MRRTIACLSAALLAACSANPPGDGEDRIYADNVLKNGEPVRPAPSAAPVDAPLFLPGEYRVAGIDGADVNLPHALTVSITQSEIRYVSQCITAAWTYRMTGPAIALQPTPPEPVCDRGRYPEEIAIEQAFPAAETVRRTAGNGIEFSGGGHSVTLFSQ